MNTSRRPAGFTLIEVLVALAVVAIALAAVQRTTVQAVTNTRSMEIATFAHWVATDRLTQLRVESEWPSVGERRGTLRLAEREWTWERTVSGTDDPRLRRVEISVRLEDDPRDSTRARLETYLLQPGTVTNAGNG
jgi:general secretion pathway protein I